MLLVGCRMDCRSGKEWMLKAAPVWTNMSGRAGLSFVTPPMGVDATFTEVRVFVLNASAQFQFVTIFSN